MSVYLGIDTSNYTTSVCLYDSESGEVKDIQSRIAEITDKLQTYFPLMLIAIISLFAALAVSMYLLYKRREK